MAPLQICSPHLFAILWGGSLNYFFVGMVASIGSDCQVPSQLRSSRSRSYRWVCYNWYSTSSLTWFIILLLVWSRALTYLLVSVSPSLSLSLNTATPYGCSSIGSSKFFMGMFKLTSFIAYMIMIQSQ